MKDESGLSFVDISEPGTLLLEEGYRLYAQIFTLPEEREPLEGFRTVLRFNDSEFVQSEFGPLRELVTLALDKAGRAVGLANYILYAYPGGIGEFHGSCQLNFVCVATEHRGQGLAAVLLQHMEMLAVQFASEQTGEAAPRLLLTCEQNNPTRMTPGQLGEDKLAAGIDAYRRLAWWQGQGYRRLDFPYAQPPLSPDHEPCTYIDYYGRVVPQTGSAPVPSALLLEHIRRFFFVSAGKFQFGMSGNAEWLKAKAYLSSKHGINFVNGD